MIKKIIQVNTIEETIQSFVRLECCATFSLSFLVRVFFFSEVNN